MNHSFVALLTLAVLNVFVVFYESEQCILTRLFNQT